MEDHVRPVLARRIPTICVLLSAFLQKRVSHFIVRIEPIFDLLDWLLTTRRSLRPLKIEWNGFSDANMQPLAAKFTYCVI
jgi:hypothetical protein